MIHTFLRSIGFSQWTDNEDLYKFIDNMVRHPDEQCVDRDSYGNDIACFTQYVCGDMGITVYGSFAGENLFRVEYYYPFFRGGHITTSEPADIERMASGESFYGVCDELKMGIPMIFFVNNVKDVFREMHFDREPQALGNTVISGLATDGKILLPVKHSEELVSVKQKSAEDRMNLMIQARDGDQSAMENLTMSDMDIYADISRRIAKEDVLTIVESSIIPYGLETDQYSVIGKISDVYTAINRFSGEKIWVLTLYCNDLTFDVCINDADLLGEPEVGRRFKGRIWMQGHVNFRY